MGDRLKGLKERGWHPKGKGEGGKESWRKDFKGVDTVANWMGKGKSPSEAAEAHQSTPLSALRDPASFGPPPKHMHYHSTAAASGSSSPGTGGLGAPVSQGADSAKARLQARKEAQARAEEEANKPPPGPYRVDTTGLSTANLPKPPAFRPSQGTPPPSASGPPRPPPRLPPRQNSRPDIYDPPPPPTYSEAMHDNSPSEGVLNQGALGRLGKAGIAVPGLEIGGRTSSPPVPPRRTGSAASSAPVPPALGETRAPQINELQSRFANMRTSDNRQAPATGTSWADKQAALKTATNLRDDPSKVSFSELRGAASTANNFRERHGQQAAVGFRAANDLGQRYGTADRPNSYDASTSSPVQSPTLPQGGINKKPPPPPPKRKELSSSARPPPPIPLGSKPKF